MDRFRDKSFFVISNKCTLKTSPAILFCHMDKEKTSLFGMSLKEMSLAMEALGEKAFRGKQLFEWLYQKKVFSFEKMTNFSKEMRVKLENAFAPSLKLLKTVKSEDGETEKFLWELSDGKKVESVLIYSGDRRTVCVSSQVGCPARCAFCASGRQGLFRNLSVSEIVEQVVQIDEILFQREERVSHVVYMGMGEPMENYESVVASIRILTSPDALAISQRRITVSTVGVIEGIHRLAKEDLKVNLVLSLHAPNQHLRKKIIPYARKYLLEEILTAMDSYAKETKRDITYEYTLLHGINDSEEEAKELATLLHKKQCTVNLIPYNPVEGLRLERPSMGRVEEFRRILQERGIETTWRYTKGDKIAAACGQLALQT